MRARGDADDVIFVPANTHAHRHNKNNDASADVCMCCVCCVVGMGSFFSGRMMVKVGNGNNDECERFYVCVGGFVVFI